MVGPKPLVHSIAVELGTQCNQRCAYCYNPPATDTEASASASTGAAPALVARVRRLLDAWDVRYLTLTGGEPLAAPALWELLALLQERALPVQIISNGGLVTPELARRLATAGTRSVQVTLNGATAALHAAHTGSEAHFVAAQRGVSELRAAGIRVVGCVVLTRLNAPELTSILELWCSLGVDTVALSRFSPAGRAVAHAARLLPSLTDLERGFAQAVPFARDGRLRVRCTMPVPACMLDPRDYTPIAFGTCAVGTPWQELALGPDGRLRHCTLHREPIGGFGDVLDPRVDLLALLASPELRSYADRHPEFCVGCLHARSCGGGCGAAGDWFAARLAPRAEATPRRALDPLLAQHVDDEAARWLGRDEDAS